MKSFNQADRTVVAALHRMKSPELKPLHAFLTEMFKESQITLIHADRDSFARMQGRAGFLEEFLAAVDQSAATLEKLK